MAIVCVCFVFIAAHERVTVCVRLAVRLRMREENDFKSQKTIFPSSRKNRLLFVGKWFESISFWWIKRQSHE